MRTAFIDELIIQARIHPKIFLVVGDLGFSVVEPFAREFPDRYVNAGISEQSMTGIAAGLASEGFHVFTYSIANFPTLRCLEQIRNDVCYHNLPVTVVAVGAGLAYGNLGYSHHAVQDIGCLRGMPNITVLSPADPSDARNCVRQLAAAPRPSYLRIGKAGEADLNFSPNIQDGPVRVCGAFDAATAIVATGSVLGEAIQAAAGRNDIAVYSLTRLAPLKAQDLAVIWNHPLLLTVEEHVQAGGIGELLAAQRPPRIIQKLLVVSGELAGVVGTQQNLRHLHGLDSESILRAIDGR